MILLRPFFATAALAAVVLSGQAQSATPDVLHEGLLKVSLTDFISGKYSLSYERVVGDWTTAEFTVTGIGMTTTDYTYTIAQPLLYPWDSFYPNLPADLDMEISGWEVQAAVRKYGWVDDGVPDGFYASAFLTAGAATVHADERIRDVAFDPDTVTFEPGAFLDEIDHTLNVTKWGFGLTIGYQWLTESGLGLDAYMGPMFRGITRTHHGRILSGGSARHRAPADPAALLDGRRTGRALQRQHRPLVLGGAARELGFLSLRLTEAFRRAGCRPARVLPAST